LSTIRQQIIERLEGSTMTTRDLSRELRLSEAEI